MLVLGKMFHAETVMDLKLVLLFWDSLFSFYFFHTNLTTLIM